LRVLHARSQKGKIPKNYYKSQRKNLEKRFDALTKDINQLKENFRRAGGNYGQLIRQLDTAEKTLSKARTSIRSSEARHRIGELPTEEYKKALTEYQQKKEKIEAQINGILLRLREELH
jgi:chromosome segregation ATPase